MMGTVIVAVLAVFGLMCGIWIGCGLALPRIAGGVALLTGPLDREALDTARRWIWLRELGLLHTPLLALEEGLLGYERSWLIGNGFELYSREALLSRLGIGENQIDRGFADPPGRDQCRGVSKL